MNGAHWWWREGGKKDGSSSGGEIRWLEKEWSPEGAPLAGPIERRKEEVEKVGKCRIYFIYTGKAC